MKRFVCLAMLLLCGALNLAAQSEPVAIRGRVTNSSGKPVAAATVSIEEPVRRTLTNANGEFSLTNLPDGEYNVVVTANEYLPMTQKVTVTGGAATVAVTLPTLSETVNVVGRISEYHTDNTTVATKIPTLLIDTPTSITSISPQMIADRSAVDINDIYKNVAGLNQTTYSAVVFRGFTQREILFNGVRGNAYGSLEGDVNNAGFSTSILRLSNIERVEVLKGPASVLFGSSEPGGVINFITKKPRTYLDGTAGFRGGEFGLRAGDFDVSIPLGGNVYSRVAAFVEERDSFRNNAGLSNQNYITNLLWQPSDRTRINFEYEYIKQYQRGNRLRGVPVDANGRFIAPIRFNAAELTDFVRLDANVLQAGISQDFWTNARFEATVRYITNDRAEQYHEQRAFTGPNNRSLTREYRDQIRTNTDWSFTTNFFKPFETKGFGRHTINLGTEYYTQDHRFIFRRARAGVPTINLDNPVYGVANPLNYTLALISDDTAKPSRLGFYFQDQVEINKYVQIVGGGRIERFEDEGFSAGALRGEDTAFTGRAGVIVKPLSNLSFYGSYANSYTRPSILAQAPSANGPFAPERGRQFEGGVKVELLERKLFITSSVYQIDKTDVLRPDPLFGPSGNNFNALLSVGAIRNRGFEIDANGAITKRWNVSFNYSHINSRITRDNVAAIIGQPMPNVPANTGGFFTRYDLTSAIGVGFGGEFVGDRVEPFAGLRAPAYKTFDLMYYHTLKKRFRFNLKLENVFNEVYSLASLFNARVGNFPGQPRTFTAGVTILSFMPRK